MRVIITSIPRRMIADIQHTYHIYLEPVGVHLSVCIIVTSAWIFDGNTLDM